MAQLASCYFCGAGPDESLSEVPVVPSAFRSDDADADTVVVCPSCRSKFDAAVSTIVDAAPAGGGRTSGNDREKHGDVAASDGATECDDAGADGAGGDDESTTAPKSTGGTTTDERQPAADSEDGPALSDGPEIEQEGTKADVRGADSEESVSKLEYSRVMRLLENRELPVDREEMRTVAVNAYDISPDTFAAVVDAAVGEGLIDEEDGRLVRPE